MHTLSIEWLLFAAAILMIASVVAGSISARMGVPALIAFLALGMVAGSDGLGGIAFEDYALAQGVGVVALALILFSGGLGSPWRAVRPVLGPALLLSTLGVVVSAATVACAARVILKLSWGEGALLGAIVASTDAAAVFSNLKMGGLALREDIRTLLEVESGANDPVAVFLVVAGIAVLKDPHVSVTALAVDFSKEMVVGLVGGLLFGFGFVQFVRRVGLSQPELYVVVSTAVAFLAYGLTTVLGGSGFLAVYVAAAVAASSDFPRKASLVGFQDGLAWLAQVGMFLTLGLLVFPSSLPGVALPGLATTAVLILVARPLAVLLCLAPFRRFGWRASVFVSWCGLRGAAPIVLATFPMLANVPNAKAIFDVVFFVVLASSLVQGPAMAWVGRRLGLHETAGPLPEAAPSRSR